MARIAVIGAGISGLVAAYRLHQAGHTVSVFEADPACGGRVSSLRIGEYLINRGADIVPTAYDDVLALYRDLGLISGEPEAIHSVVGFVRDQKIHRIRSDHAMRDGLATRLISWRSKLVLLRLAWDGWRARRILQGGDFSKGQPLDTQSASDYARTKLNDEIRRYLIAPLVNGISARSSILDFFFTATMTMGSGFVQYPGGIGLLTETLANHADVTTSCPVTGLSECDGQVIVAFGSDTGRAAERFDGVIVATPGTVVPQIWPDMPERAAYLLREQLVYSPLFPAQFGLRARPAEPAGVIFNDADAPDDLVSISFAHNLRQTACPEDKGLLTVLFTPEWAAANAHLSDEVLLDHMLDGVERIFPGTRDIVDMRHLERWTYGAQRAWPGYCAEVAELTSLIDQHSRVQLAGDYFGSSSTQACIKSADRAVAMLRRILDRVE